jgi:vitamin B12 transporter
MRIFVLVFFMVFSACIVIAGDVKDTILLNEVRVQTHKHSLTKPFMHIDSARKSQAEMQSLSRFLQENSSIQFKTYGTSGSSVMSIRGANASQSKVVWNGMNIGSPMLNMNDVSLLSLGNADVIELHKGGASATEGTGALAGYINLQSNPTFNKEKLSVMVDVNQLQNQSYQLKYVKGKSNFSSSTSFQLWQHQNKFKYENFSELGNPLQAQLNSKLKQFSIIQSFFFNLKKTEIEWHQWLQQSDRELSPPMYNRMRTNYQLDNSYRSILSLKKNLSPKITLNSCIGYTREKLRYVSRVVVNNVKLELFNSNSYFDQVQHKTSAIYNATNFSQEFLYQFNFDGAYVEDYASYVKRYRLAFASISNFDFRKLIAINWANRVELLKNANYFASSLNISALKWQTNGFAPYISISKNYNLPGLNDLYWTPGGNPNLTAERSFEQELGLVYEKAFLKFNTKTSASVYNSMVRDWILWQPSAIENGLWTPQNLVEVKLQGLELEQAFSYQPNLKNTLAIKLFYAKTLAINNKAVNANDQSVGKQIIYIPEEKWGANINYTFYKTSVNANMHRVSHRYTTANHSNFLAAYYIVDLRLQHVFVFQKHQFVAALYADNVTNTIYQSIPFQAMPARVFGININYQIIQLKN